MWVKTRVPVGQNLDFQYLNDSYVKYILAEISKTKKLAIKLRPVPLVSYIVGLK